MTGDDRLWDPARGDADQELAALERALANARYSGPSPGVEVFAAAMHRGRRRQVRRRWWTALAAALFGGLSVWLWSAAPRDPVVAAVAAGDAAKDFASGDRGLSLRLGDLVTVELEAASEVRFLRWSRDEARVQLRRGGIAVRVLPPPVVAPRFFAVDTPAGRVVDLGCRYVLRLVDSDREYVRVTEGAVEFALPARTVYVPAGASCTVVAGWPGTPLFAEHSPLLGDYVGKFDAVAAVGADAAARQRIAELLAAACSGGRDTLPLWHLLRDPDPVVRELAEARLGELEGWPPEAIAAPGAKEPLHADAEQWLAFLRGGAWTRPQ